jgi:hypothetical protein
MAVNNTRMSLDTIVEFIPRVTLLTSSFVTWRKEHIWNVSGHQRVLLSFFYTNMEHCQCRLSSNFVPVAIFVFVFFGFGAGWVETFYFPLSSTMQNLDHTEFRQYLSKQWQVLENTQQFLSIMSVVSSLCTLPNDRVYETQSVSKRHGSEFLTDFILIHEWVCE